MNKFEFAFPIKSYAEITELSHEDQKLVNAALDASSNSYAPYSEFNVGAAVYLANNKIITGSNQENAAYPSGLCAERVAIFYANSEYPNTIVKTIAICAKNQSGFLKEPVTPCGSCRQVILETAERFENQIRIILYGTNKIFLIEDARSLLPLHFNHQNLKK